MLVIRSRPIIEKRLKLIQSRLAGVKPGPNVFRAQWNNTAIMAGFRHLDWRLVGDGGE